MAILNDLETEDADYGGFCARLRNYVREYDDEGIPDYIGAQAPVRADSTQPAPEPLADLRRQLHQALLELNHDASLELIEWTGSHDATAGRALQN